MKVAELREKLTKLKKEEVVALYHNRDEAWQIVFEGIKKLY